MTVKLYGKRKSSGSFLSNSKKKEKTPKKHYFCAIHFVLAAALNEGGSSLFSMVQPKFSSC